MKLLSRTVSWVLLIGIVPVAMPGVPVREHEQPELWALVANAAVMEDTRLLGLISTRRHMFIGAPLVAEMSSAQFAAVLTHELAHYSNRDTRFAASPTAAGAPSCTR